VTSILKAEGFSMSNIAIGSEKAACEPATRVTRSLLGYGVLAGPFYVAVVLAQAAIRPGFDLLHDDASLLANGSLGWIQIANFIITGAFVLAFAVGMARTLGRSWASLLVAGYGLGLLAAGAFVADPMNGFPAGTPAGRPETISLHGMLHIVAAGIAFLCLISACVVIARRFAAERRRAWAVFSVVTGVAFLAAFAGVASGSGSAVVVIGFWAALLLAWSWMAALAVHLYRRA
jgi:hypothetical membrane protein